MSEQPDWLRECVSGMQGHSRWRVVVEGRKYAVIVCPGHSAYLNRGSGTVYAPTECCLVEKGKNFWHGTFIRVHKGRITNEVKARMAEILKQAEKGKMPKKMAP